MSINSVKFRKKSLFGYSLTVFLLLTCLIMENRAYAAVDNTKPPNKLLSFIFDITGKLPQQGMLYGPLKADELYEISCHIDDSNTNHSIAITICYDGNSNDRVICGANSKQLKLQLAGNATGVMISFAKLKPIKFNDFWIKRLSANFPYTISLNVNSLDKFNKDQYVKGACFIKKME